MQFSKFIVTVPLSPWRLKESSWT